MREEVRSRGAFELVFILGALRQVEVFKHEEVELCLPTIFGREY